jgi:hypothetical protein
MKGKPNLDAAAADRFLQGGAAAAGEANGAGAASPARNTKTFRIDRAVEVALKRAALERSVASGSRVTESDLIDQALRHYLKL